MKIDSNASRVIVSLGTSVLLNVCGVISAFVVSWDKYPWSKAAPVMSAMAAPGRLLAESFAGERGHDFILTGLALMVVFSVLFYAVLVWIALSVWGWWRERRLASIRH
jgi:hypothetical protein